MSHTRAWLALGSNLGDRAGYLELARTGLAEVPGITILAQSPVAETAPLGGADQPPYLNQMLMVGTTLPPEALLQACHEVEQAAGRKRLERWASRTLDIDLVRYDDILCDLPGLILPHPGLRDRLFWAKEMVALEGV